MKDKNNSPRVVVTDWNFPNLEKEQEILLQAGATLHPFQCTNEDEVIHAVAGADAVLTQFAPVTRRVIETLDRCRVICRYGVGVDNIDLNAARERGIPVANVPDYCVDEVADHTVALLLSLLRNVLNYHRSVLEDVWDPVGVGQNIQPIGATSVGLIGFGRIGAAVVKRLKPFGCKILICDPRLGPEQGKALALQRVDLHTLLKNADAISLHTPLTNETYRLINRERLALMKPSAVLVNTARGELVDSHALADALRGARIGGAALDVHETEPLPSNHPLKSCPNVILTPHAAWYSEQTLDKLQRHAALEILRGLKGAPLHNPVT